MSRPTDHRNLNLTEFNLDVVFGRSKGLILWQPRILAWFTDRRFRNEPLPERYREMSEAEIYRDLGCSNRIYQYNHCYRREEDPSVSRRAESPDAMRRLEVVETPVGNLTAVFRKSQNNWFEIQEKHWIETHEEMKVATWILDHSTWAWDQERFDSVHAEWGDLGAPCMYMPRVNVENLYLDTMGVEKGIFAILEWGGVVDDYFRALHENQMRMIEVINGSPIRLVCFGDNLHCATLPPKFYERYVQPAYFDRCIKLHEAGKFVYSHWDGDTKTLLPYARVSGLDGIEAITPAPQGDVTLEEVKEALGEDVFLLDGIPAIYFDPTFSEETLAACAQEVIDLFAPRLVLGISDEIASTGDIERVRQVGKIVDDYNADVTAGKPPTRSIARRSSGTSDGCTI
jgi:hypothetical protein